MSVDPRAALTQFVNALERHFELAASGRDSDDPHLRESSDTLADAFDTYDDALYEEFGVNTPFFLPADDDFDDDDDDLDEDDEEDDDYDLEEFADDDEDDEPYLGIEEDEIDYERR